jgi:hypothetical protein
MLDNYVGELSYVVLLTITSNLREFVATFSFPFSYNNYSTQEKT